MKYFPGTCLDILNWFPNVIWPNTQKLKYHFPVIWIKGGRSRRERCLEKGKRKQKTNSKLLLHWKRYTSSTTTTDVNRHVFSVTAITLVITIWRTRKGSEFTDDEHFASKKPQKGRTYLKTNGTIDASRRMGSGTDLRWSEGHLVMAYAWHFLVMCNLKS